jgi:urease accessory protein
VSEAVLRLLQLASPALPVGGFGYSEGLEVLVQTGRLEQVAALRGWLEAELRGGSLAIEAAALRPLRDALGQWCAAAGHEGAAQDEAMAAVRRWDGWLLAQREAPELRAQLRQMGGSLLRLLADLGFPLPERLDLAWPAAWAWAGLALALEPLAVVEGYLYAWTAGQISAAVRLVPLGPTDGQRLQLQLAPLLARRARELLASDPATLHSGGVGASLAQLGHGELYSRLFRS